MKWSRSAGMGVASLAVLVLVTFLVVPNAWQRLRNRVLPERDANLSWMRRPLPKGECTWYACVRAADDGWRLRFDTDSGRHARHWTKKVTNATRSDTPAAGSVMVLDAWDGNPYGHVAYVVRVSADGKRWTVTHANWALGQPHGTRGGVPVYAADCVASGEHGVRLGGLPHVYTIRGFLKAR